MEPSSIIITWTLVEREVSERVEENIAQTKRDSKQRQRLKKSVDP